MKNKVLLIVMSLIIALGIGVIIYINFSESKLNSSKDKFFLEEKYYGGSDFIKIDKEQFDNIKNTSYVLYIYNNYCNLPIPCHEIFEKYMKKKNISFLSMQYADFKETELHKTVKFAPSVIIVNDGKIVSYLDSAKDEDLDKYQDVDEFTKWIEKYINIK